MSADPTRRDLASVGSRLGDDGRLWKTAARAMASASQEFGTEAYREHVSGQVYAEADDATPSDASEFVETFTAVYDLADMGDVDALLGREAYERTNYEGHLAFVEADP